MKTLSHNTIILLVSNVGGSALAFFISILIGRGLGDVDLGVYSVVLAWIFSLSMIVDAGLSTLLTRDLAQKPEAIGTYLHAATIQRLLMGSGMLLFVWFAAPLLSHNAAVISGLRISAPLILIESFHGLFTAVFRSQQDMKPIAWLNLGMLIVQVIAIAGALVAGFGIEAALLINVLTSFGRLLAAWWIYRRYFYVGKKSQAIAIIQIMKWAFPFAIAAILAAAQQRLSVLQLEWLAPLQEVGYFAVALRFIDGGRIIPNALFGALYPSLSDLATKAQEMNRLFGRVLLGMIGFGMLAGIAGSLLAQFLLIFTYGNQFLDATLLLQVGMWTLLPGMLRALLSLYFYAQKRENTVSLILLLMLVLQLAIAYWLIPLYGALGMMLAILIVECLATLLMTVLIIKNRFLAHDEMAFES